MRRLLMSMVVRVLFVSIAFALLISAAQALGSVQPVPAAIQALHLTDCQLPCWLGITPGQTTLEQAAQRLTAAHMQTEPFRANNSIDAFFQVGDAYGNVEVSGARPPDADGLVQRIILVSPDSSVITLGDFVSIFGFPTCQQGFPNPELIFGVSPTTYTWIDPLSRISRDWYAHVGNIEIVSDSNPCVLPGQPHS